LEHFQPLSSQLIAHGHGEAREISSGMREALSQSIGDRIYGKRENNRNRSSRILTGLRRSRSIRHDDIYVRAHKLAREPAQLLIRASGIALFDFYVLAFEIARRAQPFSECIELPGLRACLPQKAHARDLCQLRARRKRPRRRAAEQRDEVAPPHSITSS